MQNGGGDEENKNTSNTMDFDGTFDRATDSFNLTVKPEKENAFTFSTNALSFKQSVRPIDHPVMQPSTLPSGGSVSQQVVLNIASSTPDSLEGCEMPDVYLCESDAQVLFDLSVNIKFGDISNIYRSSCCFEHQMLQDYPVEVFLQKGDVIKVSVNSDCSRC